MFDLRAVQAAIRELNLSGWLLYDFRGLNVLARRVAGLPADAHLSRRWFYFVPANGEPKKLVHAIEPAALDHLPGSATRYLKWQELEAGVGALLAGSKDVAMEYVPRNANPYVSRVDAGTIELVKSFGVNVIPSGDLISFFEATWSDEQEKMHFEAAKHTRSAYDVAFQFIADEIRAKGSVGEIAVQNRIMKHFADHGMITDHPPIVGQGPHSGDPHFAPSPANESQIKAGDFVLVDLWAKLDKPMAVYSDLTRTAFVGDTVPEKYVKIFNIVAAARDAGIKCVQDAFAAKHPLCGWEVDDATRAVIEKAGYGQWFIHRTGHSIGQETHGNGANIDNLETKDERRILPRTCFSIEPGIYLPEFGVRSEVNVYVDGNGGVHVTGGDPQTEIHRIVV
ncbi:M24 family metallopeptidase [Zavarzinella formosa]|uniref:M24 family metallopeptidase n=1 Tax=Zavarzinella formosa TaxID=360055 RepID=UPI0002EB51D4|nr:M24 family metallopeptidase [Zavarzinella formosa]